jgi:glyoxylase-like metal-dependent hydrolase (beta-lactamase superfamily II)
MTRSNFCSWYRERIADPDHYSAAPMATVDILVPAQRYVFAVSNGEAEAASIHSSAEGFERYKSLQQGGRTTGMVAFPNTLLIRGERDYLVDPGLIMQGAPVIGALGELGVDPNDVKDVILTHLHFDHAEGLAGWPMRRTYVHKLETEAPYAQLVAGVLEMANLEVLEGEEGEIEPGLRWIRTPGHSDGLISLLVDTDDGLVVIASDCVGPLPEYFDEMDLPEDFGPEREELLHQWKRIRDLDPAVVIPGHNPPVELR